MAAARLALVLVFLVPVTALVCQSQAPHQCDCKTADDVIDLSPLADDTMDRLGKVGWQTDGLEYACTGQYVSLCLRLKGCMQTRSYASAHLPVVPQQGVDRISQGGMAVQGVGGSSQGGMAGQGVGGSSQGGMAVWDEAGASRTNPELNVSQQGVEVNRHENSQHEVTKLRLGCTPVSGDQMSSPPQQGLWVQGRLSDRSCSLLKRLYPSGNEEPNTPPPAPNPTNFTFPTMPSPGVVTATASSPTVALLLLSTEVVLTALILVTISGIALCALGMRRMKRRQCHRHASCQNDPPPYVLYEKVPISD